MPLDSAPSMQLVYKAHTTGNITPTLQPDLATNPGASGGKILRRTQSSLRFERSTFEAKEYRSDLQVSDYRLGGKRVTGSISGELSPNTYQDFVEAAMRGTWAAALSKSNAEFTSCAATASASKFTVGASTWAAQGFRVGDVIRFTNLSTTAYNAKNYLITALSGVDATVYPAVTADMSADTSFTVATVGRKLVIPAASHVSRLFALEHVYQNADLSHLFSECRIGGMRLNLPAEGIATAEFPVLGRNVTITSGASAPYFTSPAAATTTTLLTTIGGAITIGGASQGIITAASLNLDLGLAAPNVAFQPLVPDIFYNQMKVTGELIALLIDNTQYLNYVNEVEVEVALFLATSAADNADFISIFLPRVKFTGGTPQDGQEDGVPVRLPFQALIKPAATGYDNTTMTLMDSQSA